MNRIIGKIGVTLAQTGRRLRVIDRERVIVESFEVKEPGNGQILVHVSRTQVSAGSERNSRLPVISDHPSVKLKPSVGACQNSPAGDTRNSPFSIPPDTPGYTAVGYVQAIGSGVSGFSKGDRVFGIGRHSSHLVLDAEQEQAGTYRRPVQTIDFDITDEQACFSRLGDVALHGIRRATLQPDESVAVFGQGVVGQLIVSLCKVAGAHPVIGVDLEQERLDLSTQSGASHTVNGSYTDSVETVKEITGGGAQTVFHATTTAQVLSDCIDAARYAGKVILVGATKDILEMRLRNLLVRELDIRASHWQEDRPHKYYPWTTLRDRSAVMRMIACGDLKVDHLISHVVKPEEADRLYRQMIDGPKGWMGIFFDWN